MKSKIVFILKSMHHIKYWIPLIEKFGDKYDCCIYLIKGAQKGKNDNQNPTLIPNITYLKELQNKYSFEIIDFKNFKNFNGVLITIEGEGLKLIDIKNKNFKIVSFTYCLDFHKLYVNYINDIDFCAFGMKDKYLKILFSEFVSFIEFYKKNEKKNIFLGIPYFTDKLCKKNIINKYELKEANKFIFIFLPNLKDLNINNLHKIINFFIKKKYHLLLKTRNKHTFPIEFRNIKNTKYFDDISWTPSLSLELIFISDFVINTGSSGSLEALYLRKPTLNYNIKLRYKDVLNNYLEKNINHCINFIDLNELDKYYNKILDLIKKNDIKKLDLICDNSVDLVSNFIDTII